MKIAGIIVAAGQSKRFGASDKLLADYDGKPIITYVADAARRAALTDIILVSRTGSSAALVEACGDGLRPIVNSESAQGLSSSIRAGLSALASDIDGAMILLGDMPLVSAQLINALIDAFTAAGGQRIVFPQTPDGRQGNPVLWPRASFADLMAQRGDHGGKSVLAARSHLHLPIVVDCADASAVCCDVDTLADLQALPARAPS